MWPVGPRVSCAYHCTFEGFRKQPVGWPFDAGAFLQVSPAGRGAERQLNCAVGACGAWRRDRAVLAGLRECPAAGSGQDGVDHRDCTHCHHDRGHASRLATSYPPAPPILHLDPNLTCKGQNYPVTWVVSSAKAQGQPCIVPWCQIVSRIVLAH